MGSRGSDYNDTVNNLSNRINDFVNKHGNDLQVESLIVAYVEATKRKSHELVKSIDKTADLDIGGVIAKSMGVSDYDKAIFPGVHTAEEIQKLKDEASKEDIAGDFLDIRKQILNSNTSDLNNILKKQGIKVQDIKIENDSIEITWKRKNGQVVSEKYDSELSQFPGLEDLAKEMSKPGWTLTKSLTAQQAKKH